MTQFKETSAFENLQTVLSDEIAANFVARLKEVGVPDEKLGEVTDNICYDISSAINIIGDFQLSSKELPPPVVEEVTMDGLEFELELDEDVTPALQQTQPQQPQHQVEGVLSQADILRILGSSKSS